MLLGANSGTTVYSPRDKMSASVDVVTEIIQMNVIMSRIIGIITECSMSENTLYRTIADKLPKEVVKKSPSKSGTLLRKKLVDSGIKASTASPAVEDGTIDRETFLADLLGHAANAEVSRLGLSRFLQPVQKNVPIPGDTVGEALEMMRACVAFHGYCAKAIEAAQELIVSSSNCRDLSKTKKREIGESLARFREATHTRMQQLASHKEDMGDLVRALIAKSKAATSASSTEPLQDSPPSTEPVSTESGSIHLTTPLADLVYPESDFEVLVNPDDVLDHLLDEWQLVEATL